MDDKINISQKKIIHSKTRRTALILAILLAGFSSTHILGETGVTVKTDQLTVGQIVWLG